MAQLPSPADVVAFWREAGPKRWFERDEAFDALIRDRFEALHFAGSRGELERWGDGPEGALALVLLFDQFPRNLWRGSAHAYATDSLARAVARQAVDAGWDRLVDENLRNFFYLPFQHSERLEDQDRAVALCRGVRDPEVLRWAEHHRSIIVRFGRFPHRNRVLGRDTTPEEQAFLDGGGFSG